MATRASIARHPIHPMLIVFPLGLWVFYYICEVIFFLTMQPPWDTVATYSLAGGILGALLAAIPGFVDYTQLKESRHGTVILWHMISNIVALTIFIIVFFIRWRGGGEPAVPLILGGAGLLFLAAGGWLGGRIVYIHGVGVSARRGHPEADELRPGEAPGESEPPIEKEKGPERKESEAPTGSQADVEQQMRAQRESREQTPRPETEKKGEEQDR